MPSDSTPSSGYDFFISYTSKDVAWAEWIAWQLEDAGYKTIVQVWDFKSGGVFPIDMHRALQQSQRILAVLTHDYLKSAYCLPEWGAAFADDPTGDKTKLVGIKVAPCDPDGLLAGRTYIDLVGKEPAAAAAYLLERLKPGRSKPATAPPHPGTTKTPAPTFPGVAISAGIGHSSFDIPSNLPGGYIGRLFLGRDDFLDKLHQSLLSQTHATAITQTPVATSIAGLGGIGKTHTAIAYADTYRREYTALLFMSAENEAQLNASLASLCDVLHLFTDASRPTEEAALVRAVMDWLEHNSGWLLIVDNVDDEATAVTLTHRLGRLTSGHVLITTRLHGWADSVQMIDLSVLDPDHATELLLRLTKQREPNPASDSAQARLLAEHLEGLPLAIHQAAGYINEQRLSLVEALAFYQRQAEDILGWFDKMTIPYQAPKDIGPLPVLFTWKASFDKLAPDSRRWLRVFAHLASEPIPEFLVKSLPDASEETKARHRSARLALAQADKYCLITRDNQPPRFKLHRLVQHIIRLTSTEAENATALEEAIQLIADCEPGYGFDVRNWPKWNPLQAHAAVICDHAPDEPAPEGLSWLLTCLGALFRAKALNAQAEPHYRRSLKLDEASLGKDHPNVATHLNNLAQLLKATNRLGEAEPLMRRALQIDQATFAPEHYKIGFDLNNLADLLRVTHRFAEAEPLMRRVVDIFEISFGKNHPNVAVSVNNLAQLLKATKRLSEAEHLMSRALQIDEAHFGKDHPSVARDLNNLANLLYTTRRLAEAEPLYRRALEIDEASFGKDHTDVAIDLSNLAQLLYNTNRLAEAEPMMRRGLEIFVASLGEEHPNSQTVRGNYERLRREMEDLKIEDTRLEDKRHQT